MAESFCGANGRVNVGRFDCDVARTFPNKLVLGSAAAAEADAVDSDTFNAWLNEQASLDDGNNNKLYAIHDILDPQNQTEANKEGATGEGVPQVLVEGKPKFTYSVEIGQELYKQLRKFNKRTVRVMTYDDSKNMWGVKNTDGEFQGAEAKFFITGNTQQDASKPVSAQITISYLSAKAYHDESYYVPVELGEFEPAGLLDGALTEISHSTNVYKIGWKIITALFGQGINLAAKYNASFVVGMLTAKSGVAYATSMPLTSVAYDSALKAFTVTFDSTAWTALASGAKVKLYGTSVASLVAGGIAGIEIVPLIITKP